jgi:hypothetical protein
MACGWSRKRTRSTLRAIGILMELGPQRHEVDWIVLQERSPSMAERVYSWFRTQPENRARP